MSNIVKIFNNVPSNIKIAILIIICLFIIFLVCNVIEQNTLIYKNYTIESNKIDEKVRIVQLTDLHNRVYGKDNERLISKVIDKNPDIIVVTGDMVNGNETKYESTISLLKELVKITDVYYSLGNNELRMVNIEEVIKEIKNTGTILLADEYKNVIVNENKIVIGGANKYAFSEETGVEILDDIENAKNFLNEFSSEEDFKLLLCHYPEFFIWRYSEYDIDLQLSGHTHGGSVRIPFVGGVIAPEQGFFPEYDRGYFEKNNSKIIISAGLGAGGIQKIRINNPPEITVIDLVNDKK